MAGAENRQRLWDAATEILTPQQFTAVWLYYAEQLPVQEIAQVIGRSQVVVKTILFRARRKLLPLLADRHPEDATEKATSEVQKSPCPKVLGTTHV